MIEPRRLVVVAKASTRESEVVQRSSSPIITSCSVNSDNVRSNIADIPNCHNLTAPTCGDTSTPHRWRLTVVMSQLLLPMVWLLLLLVLSPAGTSPVAAGSTPIALTLVGDPASSLTFS